MAESIGEYSNQNISIMLLRTFVFYYVISNVASFKSCNELSTSTAYINHYVKCTTSESYSTEPNDAVCPQYMSIATQGIQHKHTQEKRCIPKSCPQINNQNNGKLFKKHKCTPISCQFQCIGDKYGDDPTVLCTLASCSNKSNMKEGDQCIINLGDIVNDANPTLNELDAECAKPEYITNSDNTYTLTADRTLPENDETVIGTALIICTDDIDEEIQINKQLVCVRASDKIQTENNTITKGGEQPQNNIITKGEQPAKAIFNPLGLLDNDNDHYYGGGEEGADDVYWDDLETDEEEGSSYYLYYSPNTYGLMGLMVLCYCGLMFFFCGGGGLAAFAFGGYVYTKKQHEIQTKYQSMATYEDRL